MRDGGLREATIKGYLAKIHAILNWGMGVNLVDEIPQFPKQKRAKKSDKKTPMKGRPITGEEFERMIENIPAVITAKGDHDRWEFFLRGLFLSGLRLGESLDFWWKGHEGLIVDLKSYKYPMFLIPADSEKGGKDRILPMTPDFSEFLGKVPERKRFGRVFKFPGITGEELQLDSVSKKVSDIGEAAGVKVSATKFASAHDLRRSFGDRWAKLVPMHYLQQLMRHESLETTMRYYVGQNSEQVAEMLHSKGASDEQKIPRDQRITRKSG